MRAKKKQEHDRVVLAIYLAGLVALTIIALFGASDRIAAAAAALLPYLPAMP